MTDPERTDLSAFAGSGEMRRRFREMDWSATPVGPAEDWPPLLKVVVAMCLDSSFPMVVSWGPDVVLLYNDAYIPLLGSDLHQHALGRPARDVWSPEVWSVSSQLIGQVMRDGVSLRRDDMQFVLERNGYPEECYFTFSHSPLRDLDGGVAGMLTVAAETTGYILHQRRLSIAQQLGGLSATRSVTPEQTCVAAAEVLGRGRESVPFALVYLRAEAPAGQDEGGLLEAPEVRRIAGYGLTDVDVPGLTSPDSDGRWIVGDALDDGRQHTIAGLRQRNADGVLPGPLGPLLPDEAIALPLVLAGELRPVGVLVVGVNPYRRMDAIYREFFLLVARQLGVALADSYAYHLERSRARTLADLDKAKTEFFQNVSHELRTPLTLLLAPLADMVADDDGHLTRAEVDTLQAAVRAAQRLERMVDALFDLSHQPGEVMVPALQQTDLSVLTADVASMFRSTAERAGLTFTVDTAAGPVLADVDRAMWATIVNNLLSNALKYTLSGGISVRVRHGRPGYAEVSVADTGVGISREQQELVFERFHRAGPDDSSGSGIGLALVSDLLDALGGRITLVSTPGRGSVFTVTVPATTLPAPDVIGDPPETADGAAADPSAGSAAGTQPATRPAGAAEPAGAPAAANGARKPVVLLVEDDTDLRGYLAQVLTADGWDVHAVGDAEAAIETTLEGGPTRLQPDVVLTDIMLPGRSGLDLLTTLRAAEPTGRIPILLLTARSGTDAAVEGLSRGADDYITKPFSSQELLARVRVHHRLNAMREDAVGEAQGRVNQLRTALDSNRVIGTAMGLLIGRHRLTSAGAFQLLVRCSQRTNRKLRDVAADVLDTGSLPVSPVLAAELLRAARTDDAPEPVSAR